MSRSSEELRSALESRGIWRDFVLLRDDAKKSGVAPGEAKRLAVKQLAPDLLAITPSGKVGRPPKKKPVDPEPSPSDPATPAKPAEEKPKAPKVDILINLPEIDPSVFAGKEASINTSMRWVLANIGFPISKIDLTEAPSAIAYSTLVLCKSSPAILNDIMRSSINKLLAKEDDDNSYGGDKFDGKAEYDLAAAISGFTGGGE